jgi:hypothetical protein
MTWVAVGAAAVTVVGGALSDKNANKKGKQDTANSRWMQQEESRLGRQDTIFNAQVDDHYKQKERAGRQRGLDQFRKFSTVAQFAPEYQDTSQRIDVPVLPAISAEPGGNVGVAVQSTLPNPNTGGTP